MYLHSVAAFVSMKESYFPSFQSVIFVGFVKNYKHSSHVPFHPSADLMSHD